MAGRPRDPQLDVAVLAAAADILSREGYQGLRMDELARVAGTTKTAIYRRWPNRTAVMIDVLAQRLPEPEPFPRTGDMAADLIHTARRLAESLTDPVVRNGVPALLADGARDAEIADEFRRRIVEPQLDAARTGLAAAHAQGAVPLWMTAELLADVVTGAVLQRVVVRGVEPDDAFLEQLAALVLAAIGGGSRST